MKYQVVIPYPVWVKVEVEAGDKEAAIDQAFNEGSLCGYSGNGGYDKLVGVSSKNASVEAGAAPLESDGFQIEVTEISD